MSTEIPIWVNGKIRWLSGIDKKTTCKDVVEVLLDEEGLNKTDAKDYTIMERWRKVERQLDDNSKIFKIWSHWGNEKKEVRLYLRRIDNEVDSGRGSPINSGYIPSIRRKRNRIHKSRKPPWEYRETLHPRRLAELGRFDFNELEKTKKNTLYMDYGVIKDNNEHNQSIYNETDIYDKSSENENISNRKTSCYKSYQCSGTGRIHSTPFPESHLKKPKCCSRRESKQKVRNSENIEKLMKLILAQGATIQSQLQKLKEREEQIELLEQEKHRERIEKNGRNYLLETYLGSLKDAEIPDLNDVDENELGEQTGSRKDISNNKAEDTNEKSKFVFSEKNTLKKHQKNMRSRSENRTQECPADETLKRSLSCNTISETKDNFENKSTEVFLPLETVNAKEKENIAELRKIQSQIEIWEKIFKINKKLEKEEENLVRLHIKIKKIQSQNLSIAKEVETGEEKKVESNTSEKNEEFLVVMNDAEEQYYEKDCVELEKNLELLKSDLENNSKEIYNNFTRLMEEDEIVEEKRNYLSKIIGDLERTNHEHNILNEMFEMTESQKFSGQTTENISHYGNQKPREDTDSVKNTKTLSSNTVPTNQKKIPQVQGTINQRYAVSLCDQELPSMKPKIVKISFEDKIQNYEKPEVLQKFSKESVPVQPGALKSILKNRKNDYNKKCNLKNTLHKYREFSQSPETNDKAQKNTTTNNSYIENYPSHPINETNQINQNPNYPIPFPLFPNFPPKHSELYNVQLPKLSENINSICSVKSPPTPVITKSFSPNIIVTTKALAHNDTDSSTSSDTSGLSSMYGSSTTVEEPCVEKTYVLDTLV